jgi:long-chain fatty acid transport protein
MTVRGTPIGGRDKHGDIGEDGVLPVFYAAAPLPAGLRLGLGVNVPFGLATDYPNRWVGRYHALESRLSTVNINPALAWRAADWLSLGAGLQAQFADGELSNAVDFGTIGADRQIPGSVPGGQDGFARLDGDDWAYGWNAGVLVEPVRGTRVGVSYRSKLEHELEGEVDFSGDPAGIAAALRGAGAFTDSGARLDLTTPASLSFGVQQDVTPRLSLMAEAQWTDWSSFDQLTIEFDNPRQPDNVSEQEWEDSWFFAVGSTYRVSDTVTLRAGVAYDQSPVKDKFRTPRIPDEDRYWLSLGAGWRPAPWVDLDGSLTYVQVEDSEVDLAASDAGSRNRGDLEASYDNMIILLGLSARLRF